MTELRGPAGASDEEYATPHHDDYTDDEGSDSSRAGAQSPLWRRLWPAGGLSGLAARLRGAYRVLAAAAWVCTTSLLLVGLPLLFAYDREKGMQDQQLLPPA